ncbi:hypothetical protein PRIPAC_88752 [Pristionchus pacificus]|uniref:Uncharacterized protein n=1 Tax=Pristionchus pacificus TaxID=54126 RepID=A0A2A6CWL2_PRIPA|nr:hypothetical protein PRIPAC_88752 [Pristionchus pacificus]|eukprot:PDM82549.1 hypothetical protein PRIPAC_36942 [Pristionchus pacificus]
MNVILGLALLGVAFAAPINEFFARLEMQGASKDYSVPVDYSNMTFERYLGDAFTDEQNYEYAVKHERELKKLAELRASEGPYEEVIHHVGNDYTDEQKAYHEQMMKEGEKEREELLARKARYEASCLRRNDVPEVTIDDFFVKGLKKFCMGFMNDDVLDQCRTWFRNWNLTEKFGYDLGYKGELRTVLRIWNEDILNNSSAPVPDRLPWIGRVIDDEDKSNYDECEELFQRIKRWGRNWDIKETEYLRYNATTNTIYREDTTEQISELIGQMRDKGVPEAAIKEYLADGVEYDFGIVRNEESWLLLDKWWKKWNMRWYFKYELGYDAEIKKVVITRDLHSY